MQIVKKIWKTKNPKLDVDKLNFNLAEEKTNIIENLKKKHTNYLK